MSLTVERFDWVHSLRIPWDDDEQTQERREVEAVEAHPFVGDAGYVGRVHRPAERARVAGAGVVNEDEGCARRALGRLDVPGDFPIRLGSVEGLVRDSFEWLAADGEPGPIHVFSCHVCSFLPA